MTESAPALGENLPPLHQANLSDDTLAQLVADVETLTEVIEVQVKSDARSHAAAGDPSLGEAVDLMMSGGARGVQVRHLHAGLQWWDTLIRTPEGVRLVRIQPDVASGQPR